jgi:hypothetical protein
MAQAAAAGAQIAGTSLKTIGTVQARDIAAKSAEQEAISAEQAALVSERQSRRDSSLVTGKANAIVAASGLSLKSGSPLLMELDRAKQAEIEALSIRRSGQMQAASKRYEGRLQRRAIPFDILSGFLSMGSQGAGALGASGAGASGAGSASGSSILGAKS